MKRRNFIKSLIGLVAAPVVAKASTEIVEGPASVDVLKEQGRVQHEPVREPFDWSHYDRDKLMQIFKTTKRFRDKMGRPTTLHEISETFKQMAIENHRVPKALRR